MATININQTAQTPVEGDLDLQIAQSQTITGLLSVNQATALAAGSFVKFDATITTGGIPQFVAAAQGDIAVGVIKRTLQASSFSTGDVVEIVGAFGPVMYLTAAGSIACGAKVESDSTGAFVETLSSGKARGIAIDPVADGQLTRIIIAEPLALAS